MKAILSWLLVILSVPALADSKAVPDPYLFAAKHANVPAELLYAICLQESGYSQSGSYHPWPWTLNLGGRGTYFEGAQEAASALSEFLSQDRCDVDIGLCQIHWCAHAHVIADPYLIINPYANIQYAAALLRAEFERSGSWAEAAGRYHAPNNPVLASAYRKQVLSKWQPLIAGADQ
ncbi:transglycosylase SLT domain-containing protein [Gilvimarinus polysaccharolyticus]|uniref:transglycosylase SLT domain-containing protein n=1 Tax=Gilvimarinus polysaccharolyticus TaxID=863921 RepID=UPI0006739691|nr:transglycosylase SLT domain-containing protein [Gilvimarinus polysaccharolyticus]